jgi:uncharacterized protein (DUF305 family)
METQRDKCAILGRGRVHRRPVLPPCVGGDMREDRQARVFLVAAMLLLLSGCDQSDSNLAHSERDRSNIDTISHDLGPFFHAEMDMKEAMMAAEGSDAGDGWLRLMIAHHKGGSEIIRIFLQQEIAGPAADFARQEIVRHTRETAEFAEMLKDGPADHESAWIYKPAVAKMHDRMMAVQGVSVTEGWTRKMIEHHRGAVEITSILLRQRHVSPAVLGKAHYVLDEEHAAIRKLTGGLRSFPGYRH